MFRRITFLIAISISTMMAQLSAPDVERVYGGRINDIEAVSLSGDSTLLLISTESANSAFYTYVTSASSASPVVGNFTVIPSMSAAANLGSGIQRIQWHAASSKLFFVNNFIYSTGLSSASATQVTSTNTSVMTIKGDHLFYYNADSLHFGTMDAAGNFTYSGRIFLGIPGVSHIEVSPANNRIHLFVRGATPVVLISSDSYSTISSSTTFATVPTSAISSADWQAFGIGPDGRILIGGHLNNNKRIAYSDDGATWTEYAVGINGVSGYSFDFGGSGSSYYVYWSSVYNTNRGSAGSWSNFGSTSFETHPNDGDVRVDPNNLNTVFMTTDMGLGVSFNRGPVMEEINDGIEAVQVEDFSMTADKNTAWLASKSGIRKVTNYLTAPVWSNAMFPMGDGSPYYAVAMKPSDHNTAYAANLRVYKTTDSGLNWNRVHSLESGPYFWSELDIHIEALEVAPWDESTIFVGYFNHTSDEGGVFWSSDAGTTWSQILLNTTSTGRDVDVFDIAFNIEGSDTVAYAGVAYDLASPAGRSVYRLVKSGTTWIASQDMNAGGTSTGSLIVATIRDIHVSITGDTIYATGTDAGTNHPVAYYKPVNTTNLWTPLPVSGFPFTAGKQGYAITQGVDTIYCAVDHEIYYWPVGSGSWTLGYSYPNGTRINFLYFDELLAGTSTGLYGHHGDPATSIGVEAGDIPAGFSLEQNFPNPFNPSTVIRLAIPASGEVKLEVYNVMGEKVRTLLAGSLPAGAHEVNFDASGLPSGLYMYRLVAGGSVSVKKMILMK